MTLQDFSNLLQQARCGDDASLGPLVDYMTKQGLAEDQQESVLYDNRFDLVRFVETAPTGNGDFAAQYVFRRNPFATV